MANDNISPLFHDRPTAAPLPPQPDVIGVLESLLNEARSGQIIGLACIAFHNSGSFRSGTAGKVSYLTMLGALEDLKFTVECNSPRKFLEPGPWPGPGGK